MILMKEANVKFLHIIFAFNLFIKVLNVIFNNNPKFCS